MPIDATLFNKVALYLSQNYKSRSRKRKTKKSDKSFLSSPKQRNIEFSNGTKRMFGRFSHFENEETWQKEVFKIIVKKNYLDTDVYKRGYISRQTFSKIRSDVFYQPTKDTAIEMCIGLCLNLEESILLLKKAGFALSESIKRDVIIKYFISEQIYDLDTINKVLYENKSRIFAIQVYN